MEGFRRSGFRRGCATFSGIIYVSRANEWPPKTDLPKIHTGLSNLISNFSFHDIYICDRMVFLVYFSRVVSIIVIEETSRLVILVKCLRMSFFFYKFDR